MICFTIKIRVYVVNNDKSVNNHYELPKSKET